MMKDLLEKLTLLTEAPVKPGERKDISFKLKKLDKVNAELQEYKQSLYHMGATKLPPALKQEMDALQEKLNAEIDKVQKAYDAAYQKSLVNDRPVKMNNLFKALSKHCKEIIKVYKELNKNTFTAQRFVYRGIRANDDALYGKPFEARKPKDSSAELHDMVNNAINSLGFEANRENAMFVTGDRSQASGYGYSLYVMFPVDGFKFTWSQTVKDLVLDSGKKQQMMDSDIIDEIRAIVTAAKEKNPELPVMYPSDLFSNGYSYDSDFERVSDLIDKGLIPDTAQELLDNILTYDSTQKHFKFTDQDLFKAVMSNKEIYIKSPYYAVNVSHMDELIRFLQQEDVDSVKLPESFGEMPDTYDKGDIVNIINGDHAGKVGTITYTYSDSVEVFLNQKSGDVTVPIADVELYKLADGSIPLYEKGEKVIITDPGSPRFGTVGILDSVFGNGKIEVLDENGNYATGYKHQISPYTPELEQKILKDLENKPPELTEGELVIVKDPDSEYYKERGKINFIYSTGKVEVYLKNKDTYIDFQPDQVIPLKLAPAELKAEPEVGVYHLGDTVQITDGEWKGYYGTVDYLYSASEKAEIELTGLDKKVDVWLKELVHTGKSAEPKAEEPKPKLKVGDKVKILSGDDAGEEAIVNYVSTVFPDEIDVKLVKNDYIRTVPVSALELISDDSSPVVENFKVGDIVKVDNPESSFNGEVGKVIEADVHWDGKPYVKIINDSHPSGFKTFTKWVVKADAPADFKPNDKFKIKNKSYSVDGVIATILDGPDKDGDYKSVTVDGKIVFTAPDQMEKIEAEPEYKFAFKVGDTVKVKSGGNILYNEGKTGVVDEIYKDYGTVSVKFPEGNTVTYLDTELEKAEAVKNGDKVKIVDPNSVYNEQIGLVRDGPDTDGDYVVSFAKAKWSYFKANQLEKTTAPSVEDFKLGDVIQITDKSNSNYGKLGKINYIYPSGALGYETDEGQGGIVQASQIKKYSMSSKIDNLQWEPEPEVQAPSPKFEVGDSVEVISTYPSLIGMKGKITQTNPNYDFVSVQLDGNTAPSSFPASALKKVAQPEVDSSNQTVDDFDIYNTVEVINPNLSTYGKQGKIVDLSPTFLFIQFPDSSGEAAVKPTSVKKIG